MSDIQIGEEGKVTTDGRYIQPGALKFQNPVPVTVRGREGGVDGQFIVGSANIRVENQKIIADLTLDPGAMTFEVSTDEVDRDGEVLVLKKGTFRNILIGGKSPWEDPS